MRIACAYAPQIALQSVLRGLAEAHEREAPIALAAGPGERALILALNRSARAMGTVVGMTVTQARARVPGVRILQAQPADVEAAEAALQDLGLGFAARIDAEPERVFFEVGDLGSLYATEKTVAQAIQSRAARLGLFVRVAVASSKGLARVGTRMGDTVLVPGAPKQAKAMLGAAVLDVLGPGEETRQALTQWGLKTVGDLACLPIPDVSLRLGAKGAQLARLANGQSDEPFLPQPPADAIEEGIDLDYSVDSLEPLSFLLQALLDRALQRLECRSLACAGLTLRLKLEPRGFDVREVPVQSPTRETSTLLQLVRLDLERRPPDRGVVGMTAMLRPARVRATQLDMFSRAGPAPERWAATVARLSALVGPEHVGIPRSVDSWREEAVAVQPAPASVPTASVQMKSTSESHTTGMLAIHRFRPPRDLEVLIGPTGPEALRGKETTAHIVTAAGPYRMSGEWWAGGGFCREYWDVHASDGALYRIHKDRETSKWYLDGYYD